MTSGASAAPRPAAWAWLGWSALLAASTLAMAAARPLLDRAQAAPLYLLLVVLASARSGRSIGLTMAVAAFFLLNFFFVPPVHTFVVHDPLDWLVLAAFLVTAAVAAQLLTHAQEQATAARHRAEEIDRLAAVGAEALSVGRAEDALARIAEVVRARLRLQRCEFYLRAEGSEDVVLAAASGDDGAAGHGPSEPHDSSAGIRDGDFRLPDARAVARWVVAHGRAVHLGADGRTRVGPPVTPHAPVGDEELEQVRVAVLPLRAGGRVTGAARLVAATAMHPDAPARRFLEAILYYAALGAERVRLSSEAEHAEALRQADVLKDALLASVSHDLRTPLTTIKALAEDIRRDGDDRAATIEEEADRLNRFVADLLDLSRLSGGALAVRPEVNAVEDLVGAALQRVSGLLGARTVEVHLDTTEPLLLGRFDFVHALRVLVNLLENALKYSPAATAVELTAARVGETVELRVEDRGPGVPPTDRERIFDAFYRPEGVTPDGGGAGLGLSIARRLAEAQDGTLRYEPRDGGGSRFVLALPAADVADAAPTAPASL